MKIKLLIALISAIAGYLLYPFHATWAIWFYAIAIVIGVNIVWLLLFSSSGTQDPSWRTRRERRACQSQIADLCGEGHLFEVKGRPHTYVGGNGQYFEIRNGRVVPLDEGSVQ